MMVPTKKKRHQRCVVPSCGYRQQDNSEGRSMFRCPVNPQKAQLWLQSIPGLSKITHSQSVCDQHFQQSQMRALVDKNGSRRTRLASDAVPSIFLDNSTISPETTLNPHDQLNNRPSTSSFNGISGTYPRHNGFINSPSYNQDYTSNPYYYNFNPPSYNQNQYMDYNRNQQNSTHSPAQWYTVSEYNNQSQPNSTLFSQQQIDSNVSNQIESTKRANNHQVQSANIENHLQSVIKDLSASEHMMKQIKQETFSSDEIKIKTEMSEGEQTKENNLGKQTLYEQLWEDLSTCAKLLPESWRVTELPMGNDIVFAFSKECPVFENQLLVVMYEKNIVLNKHSKLLFSVHGKSLDIDYPNDLNTIDSLIQIILRFDNTKVCQGIFSREFEIDKDCTIFEDDLGYYRHVHCTMVTDMPQCKKCSEYSQYMLNIMSNNVPVLHSLY